MMGGPILALALGSLILVQDPAFAPYRGWVMAAAVPLLGVAVLLEFLGLRDLLDRSANRQAPATVVGSWSAGTQDDVVGLGQPAGGAATGGGPAEGPDSRPADLAARTAARRVRLMSLILVPFVVGSAGVAVVLAQQGREVHLLAALAAVTCVGITVLLLRRLQTGGPVSGRAAAVRSPSGTMKE